MRARVLPLPLVSLCGILKRGCQLNGANRLFGAQNHQKNGQHNRHNKGGKEDVLVGQKRECTVVVGNKLGILQHPATNLRSDNTGDENLRTNTHALQHSGFAVGGEVTNLRTKHRHATKVAAHHKERACKHKGGVPKEIQKNVTRHQRCKCDKTRKIKAFFVIHLAPQSGCNRCENNGRRHNENVICHTQGFFVVDDEVRHKNLNGNVKENKGCKIEIERAVALDGGGAEAVNDVLEISRFGFNTFGRILNEEDAKNTNGNHNHANNGKNPNPAGSQAQIKEHKAAKHCKNGNQRHHRIDALSRAAVCVVGAIGQPRVECRIVGRGTEKGHQAVKNDNQRNGNRCRADGQPRTGTRGIKTNEAEAENRDTPQNVACAHKELALAYTVGECTDENGGQCGRNSTCRNHGGNIVSGCVEHVVDEHIEIHILYNPRHLSNQTKQRQRTPKTRGKLGFHKILL